MQNSTRLVFYIYSCKCSSRLAICQSLVHIDHPVFVKVSIFNICYSDFQIHLFSFQADPLLKVYIRVLKFLNQEENFVVTFVQKASVIAGILRHIVEFIQEKDLSDVNCVDNLLKQKGTWVLIWLFIYSFNLVFVLSK